MRILLLIAFGALGTLARYGLEGLVQGRSGASFPFGTLAVNLLGCFFLGAVGQYSLTHLSVSPELRVALTVGFLGAFTTFSTFTWEAARMIAAGEFLRAATYAGVSLLAGLAVMFLGIRAGNSL